MRAARGRVRQWPCASRKTYPTRLRMLKGRRPTAVVAKPAPSLRSGQNSLGHGRKRPRPVLVLVVSTRRTGSPFLAVLHLPFLDGLPLHVARRVRPARAERHDMVHHVAGPTVRIPGTPQEIIPGLAAPRNAPPRIGRCVRVRACRRCAVVSSARRPLSFRSCIGATPRRCVAAWSWCRCGVAAAVRGRSGVRCDMRSIAPRVPVHVDAAALGVEWRSEDGDREEGEEKPKEAHRSPKRVGRIDLPVKCRDR